MPKYRLTSPDGKQITISGEKPPNQEDAAAIFAHVSGSGPETSAAAPSAPAAAGPDFIDKAADWLPTVGGMAGGIIGGLGGALGGLGVGGVPGAVGGAVVGGAGGEGFKRAIHDWRHGIGQQTATEAAMANAVGIGEEGAVQGAYELGGAVTGKVLGKGAQVIYRKALRPALTERLLPRAAETVQTGLEEGINPFATKSLKKIEPRIQGLNSQVESIIGNPTATPQGFPYSPVINPKDIAARVVKVMDKFAGAGAAPEDRAAARSVRQNFLNDVSTTTQVPTGAVNAGGQPITQTARTITPMSGKQLLEARRATGRSAGANSFGLTRGAETEARKELYHEMGQEIGTHFPETQPLMNRERRLIDLKDAAIKAHERQASMPIASLRRLLPFGGAMLTYEFSKDPMTAAQNALAIELATNPRLASRLALEAYRASLHPRVLANVGRVSGASLQSLMAGQEPDQ